MFRLVGRFAVAVAVVVVIVNIGIMRLIREAYPADPFKSDALAKCLAADPGFVRFLAADRARCYARQPHRAIGLATK